jgi:hypothetical protein
MNRVKKGSDNLVTEDSAQLMVRGVVQKLTKKKGEVISKKNIYKFKTSAVYGHIENAMLVDLLLAEDNFVTRVEGVY